MYFPTIFSLAVLATSVAAAPSVDHAKRSALFKRNDCGTFFDDYLGPGSAGGIVGDGQCQNMRKDGESPNDQSTHTLWLKGYCIHCDFYSDENCGTVSYGVGHSQGNDWDQSRLNYGQFKSFRC